MIHMLSRFDVIAGVDPAEFAAAYARLSDVMVAQELLVSSTPVGRRLADTPMDTDQTCTTRFFSVMTFRDRAQLDKAYAHLLHPPVSGEDTETHEFVKSACTAPVFTCWQDLS